jgi:hypothetical protein
LVHPIADFEATLSAWTMGLVNRIGDPLTGANRQSVINGLLSARPHWSVVELTARVGIESTNGAAGLVAALDVRKRFGPVQAFVEAGTGRRPEAPVTRYGFGESFAGQPDQGVVSIERLAAGIRMDSGSLTGGLRAHSVRTRNGLDGVRFADGAIDLTAVNGSLQSLGITLSAGFRTQAVSGIYGRLEGTMARRVSPDYAFETSFERSAPDLFGRFELGFRKALFQRDLLVDFALAARAWQAMGGRSLHPETGLLLLADPLGDNVPGSVLLDARLEAIVRSATLFIAFENLLSGTDLIVGNQLVPDYPYPERRFTFGIFWPIFD